MKLAFGLLLLVAGTSSFACRTVEYVELKDMSADKLKAEYCSNVRLFNHAAEFSAKFVKMGALAQAQSANADMAKCSSALQKMETALEAQKVDLKALKDQCPVKAPTG